MAARQCVQTDGTWAAGAGFKIAGKTYVEMLPLPMTEKILNSNKKKIRDAAGIFYSQLTGKQGLKPDFASIMIFHVFRMLSRLAPNVMQADFKYFRQKRAYENNTKWYLTAQILYLKHRVACFMEKKIKKAIMKMMAAEKLKNHKGGYKNKLI